MKEDLRVRRTKVMIRTAFLSLLNQKSLSEISIKEICDYAFCNRNTFYAHYPDKYALMHTLCNEEMYKLEAELETLKNTNDNELLYVSFPKILLHLISTDEDFYKAILGLNRYSLFEEDIKKTLMNYLPDDASSIFYLNGLLGMMKAVLNREVSSKEALSTIQKYSEVIKNASI